MKVDVSYLSSKDDTLTTIEKINNSNADFIHCDLMDGKYVKGKNINPFKLRKTLLACKKPLEIHLMVKNPIHYLRYFKDLNIRVIYIHFGHYFLYDLSKLLKKGYRVGLAINPDEDLKMIEPYTKYVDKVLVMCVKPGKGGQKFIPETLERLRTLNSYRLNENLVFNIEVDGGINPDTLKPIRKHIDDIAVGSYVCESKDYDEQIKNLKKIK